MVGPRGQGQLSGGNRPLEAGHCGADAGPLSNRAGGRLGVRTLLWLGSAPQGPARPKDEPGGSGTSWIKVGLPPAGSSPSFRNSGAPPYRSVDGGCPPTTSRAENRQTPSDAYPHPTQQGRELGAKLKTHCPPTPLLLSPGLMSASKWRWPSGDSAETSRAWRSDHVLN